MKQYVVVFFYCFFFQMLYAQEEKKNAYSEKVSISKDTIVLKNKSINPYQFIITDTQNKKIDSTFYNVNFTQGTVLFTTLPNTTDSIKINYFVYPEFITKEYSLYNTSTVIEDTEGTRIQLPQKTTTIYQPFDGLVTSGSISRGITIGNNQNTTTQSNLDLQITGKISEKVGLRVSLQDSNIPLQKGGYSQKLDEFDQIFIELFSDNWKLRAGDLFLENRQSSFLNFNKKVQGLSGQFKLNKNSTTTTVSTAAALVKGQYARSVFTGEEGQQGPYKLKGNNNELYVLIVSGSEKVYVNGILLKRGENNDYVIDYNAGELTFTSLFPITSEMRITVEYQYSDKNYTRFVAYGGAFHEREKLNIGAYVYSENDIKNQPLQQNLSEEQLTILQNAGDNSSLMTAPSAYEDTYSENKILYKKITIGGVEVFQFSTNSTDVLYNVTFNYIGENKGDYVLVNSTAIGKIYEYIAPLSGVSQGNYQPIISLVSPKKIQVATILGNYAPTEKTNIQFEIAASNNDENLYSEIDDNNNKGIAGKMNIEQQLYSGKFKVATFGTFNFIQKDFTTIERLYNVEFSRDWNLQTPQGNQSLLKTGIISDFNTNGTVKYQLEKLDYSDSFSGLKHSITSNLKFKKTTLHSTSSWLTTTSDYATSSFTRNTTTAKHHFKKNWIGGSVNYENNNERLKSTDELTTNSQRFFEYGTFIGRGDTEKLYVETGYLHRTNDSLKEGKITTLNYSNSYYLKSQLVKNKRSNLSVFANYRNLYYKDDRATESSLNSRVFFSTSFAKQAVQSSTTYETSSGSIAQQEFTYVKVTTGQGVYVWNDYNGNAIQELEEFEIATFSDEAEYIRVFLPNSVFLKTHQNKFSQSIKFNRLVWQNTSGIKKIISHFYNQSVFLIERKIENTGNNFTFNPFYSSATTLGLNSSFRNTLFFNRGKQHHSTTYIYNTNEVKSLLNSGSITSAIQSHQLNYQHLFYNVWLLNGKISTNKNTNNSENYSSKNFNIRTNSLFTEMSYLFSNNAKWNVFYELNDKSNKSVLSETLQQHRIGTSFSFNGKKGFSINGEYSFYNNEFSGDNQNAVAFQMLQGLQAGKNSVWQLFFQKNITQYLSFNLNYQGRKSETSKVIHTGNVQLRAFF